MLKLTQLGEWRNGLREGLKNLWAQVHVGSNPTSPTMAKQATAPTWTPELAYAIGLLVTDGSLSKDGRHIVFRSSDYQLLEVYKRCLGLQQSIVPTSIGVESWTKKQSYRIQFSNAGLYRWLETIGLTPAKTFTIGALDLPDKYFIGFLRGHLDGDGTIRSYTDNYNSYRGRKYRNERLAIFFISASNNHILWLRSRILELTGCTGAMISYKMRSGNFMWVIKYSKKESITLLKQIYYSNELPCLQRKMLIAFEALKRCSAEKRKTYSRIS